MDEERIVLSSYVIPGVLPWTTVALTSPGGVIILGNA